MATAIICVILIIVCYIGIRSTVKRVAHGCCGSGGDEVKKVKVKDRDLSHYPYTCRIEVNGMTCSNCKKRVENAFNEREGFFTVVDMTNKLAVIHMKEEIAEEDIRGIIRKAGYQPGKVLHIVK